ncbi:olfactory receptor 1019-like [Xenopus tropicalis]|uniref:Olfactory receptor n=1 Tax=Xenopus tropicalis TaxID=8364 RepID=A0A8J0QJ29_XENTR|nr:olfactory receptor 1019-like [Xenopus tropicalis]
MEVSNETRIREFIFTGLANSRIQGFIFFVLFFFVYVITVVGNSGMVALVCNTSQLQTPMYCFLGCLSMVDLCYSSVIAPKMLADLVSRVKSISFIGCALQFFFFAALAATESLLLSCMSYDRYVAICRPLHYSLIMTEKKSIGLILTATSIGFSQSSVQTVCIFSLRYCGWNQIDHFYCEVPPLLKLSCSDTFSCDLVTIFFFCSFGMASMMIIVVSYLLIVSSILGINSTTGRRKAFSTCSSHLTCVCIFYGTTLFIYLRPPSRSFDKKDKVASVFYTMVIPMLNPLIYSLRNQEVMKALKTSIRCSSSL